MKILLGADPEIFVRERATGELASAHGLVKGDKKNPFPVPLGAVQVDGMALEFNIDPAEEGDFERNITSVMRTLEKMCPKYDLVPEAVAHFGHDLIQAQPFEARELGCEPDFNAWDDGRPNNPPNIDTPFRTGAGHIHIGWCEDVDNNHWEHIEACHMVCKQLDFLLALPALLFDTGGKERRELYGAAGAYRPKSYGVEYRTLSNFWISEPRYIQWVEKVTRLAIDLLMADEKAYIEFETNAGAILAHINGEDWVGCPNYLIRRVIHFYNIPLPDGWIEEHDCCGDFTKFVDTHAEDYVPKKSDSLGARFVEVCLADADPLKGWDYEYEPPVPHLKDMDYNERLQAGGIDVHKGGR